MKKIILLTIPILLLTACNGQEKPNKTNRQSITMQSISYELIGTFTHKNITYKSIYTKENLESAVNFHRKKLSAESTKSDMILLFYNNKVGTPSSTDLKHINKRLNKNLIGGIEKNKGKYYILNSDSNNQLIRGKEIIQTLSIE